MTTAPLSRLEWWQWGQLLGWALLALAGLAWWLDLSHPLLLALALHVWLDFVGQSNDTSVQKAQGDLWATAHHSFVSGGFPGLVFGLPGFAASVLVHFLIDACRKFGLTGLIGGLVDQAMHLATLVALWSMLS